jgi:hypothetical protein
MTPGKADGIRAHLTPMEINSIISLQTRDGGWPYRKGGGPWTEPTALALLVQLAAKPNEQNFERGLVWLRAAQRQDGGWPPSPSVAQSTWVTAIVMLLPREVLGRTPYMRGLDWLMGQTGQESTFVYKLRNELLGNTTGVAEARSGWPFFPGAAAWVTPTAISILALEKARRYRPDSEIQKRIETGREFLLDRICRDGGWNYGRSRVLGVDADSYPETTGQALLALGNVTSPKLKQALVVAEEHARRCQSISGLSWLRLGLHAHGIAVSGPERRFPCRNLVDSELSLLAQAAIEGHNVFLT